jgi:hypothetical protein
MRSFPRVFAISRFVRRAKDAARSSEKVRNRESRAPRLHSPILVFSVRIFVRHPMRHSPCARAVFKAEVRSSPGRSGDGEHVVEQGRGA